MRSSTVTGGNTPGTAALAMIASTASPRGQRDLAARDDLGRHDAERDRSVLEPFEAQIARDDRAQAVRLTRASSGGRESRAGRSSGRSGNTSRVRSEVHTSARLSRSFERRVSGDPRRVERADRRAEHRSGRMSRSASAWSIPTWTAPWLAPPDRTNAEPRRPAYPARSPTASERRVSDPCPRAGFGLVDGVARPPVVRGRSSVAFGWHRSRRAPLRRGRYRVCRRSREA